MKIRSLTLALWLCLASLLSAQNINVASFNLDPKDLTANLEGTTVYDQNGQKCALIRIQTTQKGFYFDVGALGVQKVDDNKVGEVWVYVPEGVKRISIRHQQLGSLLDYGFPVTLMGCKTYVMQLTTAEVQTIVKKAVTQQYVVFRVSPPEAVVEFDGDILDLNEGVASKRKAFGTYNYTVQSKLYHPQSGQVAVNDPKNKQEVKVELRPAFGYIEVPEEGKLAGAKVFIDNEYKGTVPFRSERLASGDHQVRVVQQMYSPVAQAVSVKDGETTRFAPSLSADFARITLRVEGNAEIWVNDERKGTGTWTGDLATGDYQIECRLPSHRSATKELAVTPQLQGQTIALLQPTPIYGALDINSVPIDADIYLDGNKIGTTPMQLPECLIGSHTIKISKAGHSDFTKTFSLAEGITEEISARLESGKPVTITAPEGADIYVDGAKVATTHFEGALSFGNHTAYAMQGGKKSGEKNINVSMQGGDVPAVTLAFVELIQEPLTFVANGVPFTIIPVEGGTFQMGSNECLHMEKPVHQVTLSDYHIGQTEVTQELWEAVMGSNPSTFKGAKNPVHDVSWNDCREFISKLNSLTDANFRLPTEAEWEFAARGGNKSRGYKYSGSNNLGSVAWYADNIKLNIHPVGCKLPNELGLYDMTGSFWEWCADWEGPYPSSPQTNPMGPTTGSYRVYRGGSWYCGATMCHVAYRGGREPTYSENGIGLRLAH